MAELKNTISSLLGSVAKSSKELVKVTKLNLDLNSEESKLKAVYHEIGKKVHEIYTYGGSLGAFFDEKYLEILKREERISAIKNMICVAKGVKICSKCGKNVDKNADFCSKCGCSKFNEFSYSPDKDSDMPDLEPEPTEMEPPAEINLETAKPPVGVQCTLCGHMNYNDAEKFCLSCGRMLK